MSKKHFIELANAIIQDGTFAESQIDTLCSFCKSQNYNFNKERFVSYIKGECGPSGGKVKE